MCCPVVELAVSATVAVVTHFFVQNFPLVFKSISGMVGRLISSPHIYFYRWVEEQIIICVDRRFPSVSVYFCRAFGCALLCMVAARLIGCLEFCTVLHTHQSIVTCLCLESLDLCPREGISAVEELYVGKVKFIARPWVQ